MVVWGIFIMAKSYSDKLKDPRWQKKRLKILERDDWTCQLCDDKETTLNVHHLKYTGKNPWDAPSKDLITYCEHCHEVVEYFKKLKMDVVGIVKIGYNEDYIFVIKIKSKKGIVLIGRLVVLGFSILAEVHNSIVSRVMKFVKNG